MKNIDKKLNRRIVKIHKYEIDLPVALLALLTSFILAYALSFVTSPDVTPNNPSKLDNLVCNWEASGDMIWQNVSWYNGTLAYRNDTNQTPPSVILSSHLAREEIWNCTVKIGNGTHVLEAYDRVTIGNAPPTSPQVLNETGSDMGTNVAIYEDTNRTLNFTATEPDGDKMTFSAINTPSGSSFNTTTGQFKWGMDDAQVGQYNITFIALDNQSPPGSVAVDINLTVIEVNDPPYFSPNVTNKTAMQGTFFSYIITGADEENNFPFNMTFTGGPGNLVITNASNTTHNLSFLNSGVPQKSDVGNYTINVTINDSRGGWNKSAFVLEVRGINNAPVLSFISNQTGSQNSLFTLFVNSTDIDQNDTLNFSVRSVGCALANPWTIRDFNQTINSTNVTISYGVINQTTNNTHVVCKQVNISVSDGFLVAWQQITINISNVNDQPVIYEDSNFGENTFGNTNMAYVRATTNKTLIFHVNASDPDQLTEEGEVLSYSDNTTLFDINQTGVIVWAPTSAEVGNNSITITVTDDQGLSATRYMTIEVRNNTVPVLNTIGTVFCSEDVLCTKFITGSDAEGDALTFISNNTDVFNIVSFNSTAALLNYTPNQSLVNNYSIQVTVKDVFNENVSESFTFRINNTNDAPVLGAINLTNPPFVVNKSATYRTINASDEDYFLTDSGENLTFYVSFNTTHVPFNFTTVFNSSTNESIGILNITPLEANISNYRINISVRDRNGALAWRTYDFTIFNDTQPPNITMVRPYGAPVNSTTVHVFINTSQFNDTVTNITLQENTSTLLNITVTDDVTAPTAFIYYWLSNNSQFSSSANINRTYGYLSAGQENITLFVEDSTLENSSWTWIVTINDTNRGPQLKNSLDNFSVGGRTTLSSYLYQRSNIKYIDPDDDENDDGIISGNETNNLNFNVTTCNKADITISGTDIAVDPTAVGSCTVTFTAYDSGAFSLSNVSNEVTINITSLASSTSSTTTTTTSTTSSGGASSSGTAIVPTRREIKSPFNLIIPQIVSYIENKTVVVPVKINNSMGMDLFGVNFSASTNESGVVFRFIPPRFDIVGNNQLNETLLEVSNFTFGKNFAIEIKARSEIPALEDSAELLIISEGTVKYAELVQTRIAVAESLLRENLECRELNELLDRAKDESKRFRYQEALQYVDAAINGCKYLMAKTRKRVEEPRKLEFKYEDPLHIFYVASVVLLLVVIGVALTWEYKLRRELKLKKVKAEVLGLERFWKK